MGAPGVAHIDVPEAERVRIGYSTAIQMATYEGQIIWRTFSAMTTANTLLLALAVFMSTNSVLQPKISYLLKWFPVLGILLCLGWFVVLKRQFGYYSYWFTWARNLEKFLDPPVRITLEGRQFGAGETAHIGDEKMRMWGITKLINVHRIMISTIGIFAFLYYAFLRALW